MGKTLETITIRFWSKVNKHGLTVAPSLGPCWEWTAYLNSDGYGKFNYKNTIHLAHRISWILEGNLKDVKQLDHVCKNRKCVRPSHLEPVTNQVNSQRGKKATLNPTLVKEIRRLYKAGGFTYRSLAKHLGIGKGAVDQVLRGLTWTNIQ